MRSFISSFCRLIASFLVMTVMASGIAMAAYVCPQEVSAPVKMMALDEIPCAEMDEVNPVQCAEHQSGSELALEHLAAAPVLSPVIVGFIIPAPTPDILSLFVPSEADVPSAFKTSPPYLRTHRLRI